MFKFVSKVKFLSLYESSETTDVLQLSLRILSTLRIATVAVSSTQLRDSFALQVTWRTLHNPTFIQSCGIQLATHASLKSDMLVTRCAWKQV